MSRKIELSVTALKKLRKLPNVINKVLPEGLY